MERAIERCAGKVCVVMFARESKGERACVTMAIEEEERGKADMPRKEGVAELLCRAKEGNCAIWIQS